MILEVRDVHTYYGQSHVLHGVSLALQDGQVAAVVGRNGMGKTTLIRSIAGLTPPRRGSILFQGREICGLPPHAIARMGMALVPQGRRIFPSLSVEENLLVGARRQGRWTLESVYHLFGRLAERRHHRGHQLSGGEQQMLSIGRALMTNPHLLLLDEPSEGLAPRLVEEVAGVLTGLKRLGLAAVLVEQNLPLALRVADVVYVLSKGQVVFTGTPDALRADREILGRHLALEVETGHP